MGRAASFARKVRARQTALSFNMNAAATLAVMLPLLCSRSSAAEVSSSLFHRVMVSHATLLTGGRVETVVPNPPEPPRLRAMSIRCHLLPWCDLWWCDPSTGDCFFSNMIVMPDYAEVNTADALACYTRRHKDFATGSSITSTPEAIGRVSTSLVDGIFDMNNLDFCYSTAYNVDYPWLLIDLLSPKDFRVVMFLVQTKGQIFVLQFLQNLEVRVGMTALAGNFESYSLFGRYAGPPLLLGEEVLVEVPTPVTARFVAIQKMETVSSFQICHVEVY